MVVNPAIQSRWAQIPQDVLGEIFFETIPYPEEERFASAQNLYEDPTTPAMLSLGISHVCRQWRQAAISFPKLWSFLDVVQVECETKESRVVKLMDTYLQRSGSYQLTIVLGYNHSTRHTLLKRLLQASKRWVTVCIDAYGLYESSPTSTNLTSEQWNAIEFPALKNLVVFDFTQTYTGSCCSEAGSQPKGTLVQKLQTCDIIRYYNYCSHPDLEFQDDILHFADKATLLRYDFRNIPPSLHELATATLDNPDGARQCGFSWPKLRYAMLNIESDDNIGGFLHWFTFPEIRGLNLRFGRRVWTTDTALVDIKTIQFLIPNYFANLRVLRLCGYMDMSSRTFTMLIPTLHRVTDLTIELGHRSSHNVLQLAKLLTDTPHILVPRLKHLRLFAHSEIPRAHADAFADMLSLRFGGLALAVKLRSFVLFEFADNPTAPTSPRTLLNRLTELQAQNHDKWDVRIEVAELIDLWQAPFGGEFLLDI
ncbi:hypothetical protein MIND_01103800 [Mycena indigotica]|uniref:F-box domain-containing protein n=1 Tax=Mycena indigotica TaxID=2126181 RepID=A0A8H6VXL8_9AGAR|nr:uncharacterized protein MIND_01103800 [Mycena indigotica]KAF7295636.1 hypothetical protein MIND_01103800 [Mycena indigotica]